MITIPVFLIRFKKLLINRLTAYRDSTLRHFKFFLMDYANAIEYLEDLMPTSYSPGLERFAAFADYYDNPQNVNYKCIHVAGTNGKGSVVAIVEECLRRGNVKSARYTGPHLLNWTERIQVGGLEISRDEFARVLLNTKTKSDNFASLYSNFGRLSWFELITAMAFFYFQETAVETAVFEVGLGGRWDATNVISSPVVTAIVTVSLDHTHILGDSISAIASEKAEIIKANVPVVTACSGEALTVIRRVSKVRNAPLITLDEMGNLAAGTDSRDEKDLLEKLKSRYAELQGRDGIPIKSILSGQSGYQKTNASVAAAILGIYEILSEKQVLEHFADALRNYFWPGRLQYFQSRQLLIDGAHNEGGAAALRASLDELFPNKRRIFVLSFYKSKQFEKIISILVRPGDIVMATEARGRRAVVPASEIITAAEQSGATARAFEDFQLAFNAAQNELDSSSLCIAAGSFASVTAALVFMGYETLEASRPDSQTLFKPAQA